MRILFVSPAAPYPPRIGSAVITLNQIRVLSARHTIDLISFKDRAQSSDLGELPCWCNKILLVERPARWRVVLSMVSRVFVDPLREISRARSSEMSRVVAERLAGGNYDIALFQTIRAAQFRPDSYSGPTMWSLEDPPALKTEKMLAMFPWCCRPLYRQRIRQLRRYDIKHAKKFGCVTFVNREDAQDYMNAVPGASADFVPHGVDQESAYSANSNRRKGMIVITGNMYHPPNVDAVEFFCRDIFPLICQRDLSANLWLVGANPVARVRKWARDPRIKVTGLVPDVRTYLREATVSVCPVRLRIGAQTKILEALACGTPVVTTSAGNYGIGAVPGQHLHVADDPEEFADRVVSLLSAEKWNELSHGGQGFVRDNFSWENSTAKLEQIMKRLMNGKTTKLNSA